MIKLDNLKVGDCIFKICKYHLCQKIQIVEEKREFEYQSLDKPTIYVVVGKSLETFGIKREQLFSDDEENLFRTEAEAQYMMNLYREKQKDEWSNKDNLIKYMFNKFENSFTMAEKKLIKEIISKKSND